MGNITTIDRFKIKVLGKIIIVIFFLVIHKQRRNKNADLPTAIGAYNKTKLYFRVKPI